MKKTDIEIKNINIKLVSTKSKFDEKNNIYYGAVKEPKHLNELIIDVYPDMIFDFDEDRFRESGNTVIDLTGSSRSLKELGIYLINLSTYETVDPDYHNHFDGILDSENNPKVNLIIRKRNRKH